MRNRVLLSCLMVLLFVGFLKGQKRNSPEDYVRMYAQMAMDEMRKSGVPASITLSQGMLESEYGNSYLARNASNHFGIKCHNDWKGEREYRDDDRKGECFRKYQSVMESFDDHSNFLRNKNRYQSLFELEPTDYKGWAHGLKKAGYATDPGYAKRLIEIIEKYNLQQFDKGIKIEEWKYAGKQEKPSGKDPDTMSVNPFKADVMENNRIHYVIVKEGETLASLTKKHELMPWQLPKYNDLDPNAELISGQIIYLQPKRFRAEAGFKYHTVKEGETMYSISQKYGVKLKRLYRRNRMKPVEELVTGQKVYLRCRRPKSEMPVSQGMQAADKMTGQEP